MKKQKLDVRGFSPHALLVIAQAKVDGISPASVLQKYFSTALFEMRTMELGDWENSVVLGIGVVHMKADGAVTLRAKSGVKIKMLNSGLAKWFCIKSKKSPGIYFLGSCGSHNTPADLLMNTTLVITGAPSTVNTMVISGL